MLLALCHGMRFPLALLLALLLHPLPLAAETPEQPEASQLCRAAVSVAEREAGTPPGLLAAIARVESGRRDPAGGPVTPWPWTINAEGRGSFFPSMAAAIAAVRQLQAKGVRSIDIGCMQVNLNHHPNAFPSLEAAFDPLTNARYGARYLQELHATARDWMKAAGHYHSQTPDRAEGYRGLVAQAWAAERQASGEAPSPAMLAALQRLTPQFRGAPGFVPPAGGGGAMLGNRTDRVSALPLAEGQRGRGLDAYRSQPVLLARGPVP